MFKHLFNTKNLKFSQSQFPSHMMKSKIFLTKAFSDLSNTNKNISIPNDINNDLKVTLRRGKNRPAYKIKENDLINGFRVQKINRFDQFQMTGYSLEHEVTGAKYFHLDSSDMNNTMAVHFCTPAFDNSGVFHILEHLSLCGSKKYPVRDPFMNMIKRSLNSYMNAWTGPDFTMYLFAAQNEKDFQNLRDVYTDACFFPNLNYFDFLQEGWRYDYLEPGNKTSGLLYKGVVLNEMKGEMSRQESYFMQKLQAGLLPDSAYIYNSGGEPQFIPQLKYEDLVNTHKKFYHPSNSKFFSYGDMNFLENLDFLQGNLLSKFPRGEKISVGSIKQFSAPREVMEFFQPELNDEDGDKSDKNTAKIALCFLLNDISHDSYETFKLSVLAQLLMEGPNSTMYKRLINSGLAPGYCHGYGIDTSLKNSYITIGVQNIANDYKKFKEIEVNILEGLEEAAKNGFKQSLVDEVLHLVEYDSKKPKDDFGVNFLSSSSGFLTHSDYPFSLLHVNDYAYKLRKDFKSDPELFQNLIKKYLISNPHRLKLILRPKKDFMLLLNKEETENLNMINNKLSQNEVEKIFEDTNKLSLHQSQVQNMDILPCLSLDDIPSVVETLPYKETKLMNDIPLLYFDQPTNGITFVRIKADIKDLPDDLKAFVPLYNLVLPRLGTKNYSYEEFQNKLHTSSAGLNISLDTFTDKEDNLKEFENLVFEFSFLDENMSTATNLYSELFSVPNFFDLENLNDIIKQESVKIANEIVNNSLDYAISYANSGLKSYKKTYDSFTSDMQICKLGGDLLTCASPRDLLQNTAESLFLIHNLVFRKDALAACLHCSTKVFEGAKASIDLIFNDLKNQNDVFERDIELKNKTFKKFKQNFMKTIIQTPAQVNDCVEVFQIPNFAHEDYAKCVIMSNLIGLNTLHKEIREKGGAYGSGASPSDSGLCVFYSFRDPHPVNTYKTFEKAIINASQGKFLDSDVKEAKLYTFSLVDKIVNPSNKGLELFLRDLSESDRNNFRRRLLAVNREDIIHVAKKYFIPQLEEGTTSRCLFGSVAEGEAESKMFNESEWDFIDTLDFLSESYFTKEEQEEIEEK
jgi:Zn-dependent M16 (insulinase) family peptidase